MRNVIALLLLASLFAACTGEAGSGNQAAESEANAPAPAAEKAQPEPAAAAAPAPRFGGAVVATGDHFVEVIASADGNVDAAVTTAAGADVTGSDVSALEVTLQGEGAARHKVALSWDAPRMMFHGVLTAGARFASGPLDVTCSIAGKPLKGRLELAVVLPRPRFGGRMMAIGNYSAEVVPKLDGQIDVHLRDMAGAALKTDAGLALHAKLHGKAGAGHEAKLRWDPARAYFTGKLTGEAALAPGAFELSAGAGMLGRVDAIALLAPPSLGGTVIATGEYSVEVAPQVDGHIDAVVRNSAGAAIEGGVQLDARVLAGGELRAVALKWEEALLRFRGKLEGDLTIEPGPIELSLLAGGRLHAGAIGWPPSCRRSRRRSTPTPMSAPDSRRSSTSRPKPRRTPRSRPDSRPRPQPPTGRKPMPGPSSRASRPRRAAAQSSQWMCPSRA